MRRERVCSGLAALSLAVAACGAAKPLQSPARASVALRVSDLQFDWGENATRLRADGTIEIRVTQVAGSKTMPAWMPVAQLSSDGRLQVRGKMVGHLCGDGRFAVADGTWADFRIEGDAIVMGSSRLTIGDDGLVIGAPMGHPLRVRGITDAGSHRAALLIVAILTSGAGLGANATPGHGTPP